ncbi:TRAP transporter small permease [Tritonibacter horizontis]|uniref:TRAP transporter small permease protein n=1 Tax=Tritonibacter horizontis TaxID=1768241 RepID=A0A132C1Q0_9RHOB|nr:TRAP transporter small permease [Tritonibacter horizontis]KUP94493.1 2,3-diketo-L-gulonate TRAP transporter small permease protein YiaM [Tritonibacter horizontis]
MKQLDHLIGHLLRAVPIACLGALFTLLFVNVVARTLQLAGFAWFDEIVQGLFAWMVFAGAAALWREHGHFQVLWLVEVLSPGPARALRVLIALLALCFLVTMTWHGATLTAKARALTPILGLPTSYFYAAIPVSGAVMIAYALADLFRLLRQKDPSV